MMLVQVVFHRLAQVLSFSGFGTPGQARPGVALKLTALVRAGVRTTPAVSVGAGPLVVRAARGGSGNTAAPTQRTATGIERSTWRSSGETRF